MNLLAAKPGRQKANAPHDRRGWSWIVKEAVTHAVSWWPNVTTRTPLSASYQYLLYKLGCNTRISITKRNFIFTLWKMRHLGCVKISMTSSLLTSLHCFNAKWAKIRRIFHSDLPRQTLKKSLENARKRSHDLRTKYAFGKSSEIFWKLSEMIRSFILVQSRKNAFQNMKRQICNFFEFRKFICKKR